MKNIILSFSIIFFIQCNQNTDTTVQQENEQENVVQEEANPEREAIEQVIQNYFDGWLTGDSTLVGSAMHGTCHLKYIRDGKMGVRNRTEYLSGFKPRPRLENAEGRIIDIDITRTAASAKIELETEKRLFTDYFNLLKEDNRWYITDKVSTSINK